MGSYKISSDALERMERVGYDIHTFYYDPERNVLIDECGHVICAIFEYVRPSFLYLFKHKKEYMITWTRWGDMVELIYMGTPEHERYIERGECYECEGWCQS